MQQGQAPRRVGQHVHGAPAGGHGGRGGEAVAQGAGHAHEDHEHAGQGAEADEDGPAAEGLVLRGQEPEGDHRGDPGGVRQRQLDPDVHQQEHDRGDRGGAVHRLGQDALAGVEDHPVLGDEPPDHGAAEEDEGEDAGAEVEELGEGVVHRAVVRHHGRPPHVRDVREGGELSLRGWNGGGFMGATPERFGKAVPLPHSKWRHTREYEV
ncbi:hypothetical protein SAM23877_2619 [Streptomyces ambofaciens ATCC 23877]|uniref:Uncharacterized protein n=1 Tax=Streptomyces ambofaciens (strain ATCC 23877 / 3486 / DSM 40053 / JCM 4204 / NBRC 12836 / NRRL B-2516) TaxID=278992 RepID=A0A0K2ARP7_STRA7|nr:hypothetical protein SAM23877_2619 [Streptomyces ambofaciens ATCC 23877]